MRQITKLADHSRADDRRAIADGGHKLETSEEKALRFRYRAAEIRALAVLTQDERARRALRIVATYYENMAMVVEARRSIS